MKVAAGHLWAGAAVVVATLAVALAFSADPESTLGAVMLGLPMAMWVRRRRRPRLDDGEHREVSLQDVPRWLRMELSVHWADGQRLLERRRRDERGGLCTEWVWLDEDGDEINVFRPPH
jgi:hypothetical protein